MLSSKLPFVRAHGAFDRFRQSRACALGGGMSTTRLPRCCCSVPPPFYEYIALSLSRHTHGLMMSVGSSASVRLDVATTGSDGKGWEIPREGRHPQGGPPVQESPGKYLAFSLSSRHPPPPSLPPPLIFSPPLTPPKNGSIPWLPLPVFLLEFLLVRFFF